MESKPSMRQRWKEVQPTKMATFWLCLGSVVVAIILGFTWGGWMTSGGAQEAAQAMAKDAVVQRLAPICYEQFNQDPDSAQKLNELAELSSYQQTQFVQDQGWAIFSGEEKADRNVVNACIDLILEMEP